MAKRNDGLYKIKFDDVFDLVLIMMFSSIICARAYYVLFNLDYYSKHISEIFKIWNGGLAIYGGIIGGIISAVIFCKIRKIKLKDMLDFLAPLLVLGQAIGRWGNFINQEAYRQNNRELF